MTAVFLIPITSLFAQEQRFILKGDVCDENGPLAGAVILYVSDKSDVTDYALSGKDGNFVLTISNRPSLTDSVKVSMLGYASRTLPIDASGFMHISLKAEAIRLNEVIVRTPKVNVAGDTVKFNVQSFVDVQDKSISDVLKRMPGIEVRKDGSILYNGESIENLYIEGMDLLDGKYTLLSENLPAKDVNKVEVIERHQPIRALAEMGTPTKPAINLKLREQSKGKWLGNAGLAGGLTSKPEALWDANLFIMRIGRKWNTLNNVKSNNTGKDLSKELQIKSINKHPIKVQSGDFISIGTSNAPLDENRVKFNTAGLVNTSNLWKTKNDMTIRASLSYLFDKLESWNESSTTYYFNDGDIQTVDESDNAMTKKHRLQASLEVETNKKDYYFRNVLTTEGEFADAFQIKGGEFQNSQNATLPYCLVNDDLKYVKRTDNRAFSVESHNDFSSFNQRLTVLRPKENTQRQSVSVMDFNTDTYISTDFIVADGMTIGVTAGFEASVRSLESLLESIEIFDNPDLLGNNQTAAYIRPYISPKLEFSSKRWEIRLAVPTGWSKYWGVDTNHFTSKASGSVKYSPWPKLSFEMLGSASVNGLDIHNMYSGYIMQNYRYLKTGSTNDARDHYYSMTGHINFKDPINMLFIDGIVSRSWNVLQTSATRDFLGDYIVLGTESVPNHGNSWYAALGGNVGIYGINGKIGATVSYQNFASASIQNGVRTPYISHTISFIPTFSGRFARWIGMEYKLIYSHNILSLSETGISDSKNNFSHTLTINVNPVRNMDLKVSAEHYFTTLTSERTKNTVLFDASLAYRFNNGVEISITACNLLNQQSYAYSVFNGLQEFSCMYRIRPLNILAGVYFHF